MGDEEIRIDRDRCRALIKNWPHEAGLRNCPACEGEKKAEAYGIVVLCAKSFSVWSSNGWRPASSSAIQYLYSDNVEDRARSNHGINLLKSSAAPFRLPVSTRARPRTRW